MLRAMRQWSVAISIGAVIAIFAPPADARDEAQARLRYERSAAAAACVDESGMRDAVAARLGYDPFVADAAEGVAIALDRRGGQWQAHIVLEDGARAKKGARSLSSREKSCDELVSAVSLAVALAIDPMHFSPPAAAASGPAPASESPAPAPASGPPRGQPEAPRPAEETAPSPQQNLVDCFPAENATSFTVPESYMSTVTQVSDPSMQHPPVWVVSRNEQVEQLDTVNVRKTSKTQLFFELNLAP